MPHITQNAPNKRVFLNGLQWPFQNEMLIELSRSFYSRSAFFFSFFSGIFLTFSLSLNLSYSRLHCRRWCRRCRLKPPLSLCPYINKKRCTSIFISTFFLVPLTLLVSSVFWLLKIGTRSSFKCTTISIDNYERFKYVIVMGFCNLKMHLAATAAAGWWLCMKCARARAFSLIVFESFYRKMASGKPVSVFHLMSEWENGRNKRCVIYVACKRNISLIISFRLHSCVFLHQTKEANRGIKRERERMCEQNKKKEGRDCSAK